MSQSAQSPSAADRLVARILRFSRLIRIVLAGVFALAVTLSLTPLIDRIYLEYFFNIDTRMVPSLLATVVGLLFYGLGWRLIVGYVGEKPNPRPAVLWYFCVGAAACVLVILLVILGAITGTME